MGSNLREIHQIGADTREAIVPARACPALAALGIQLCGISEARPGFRFVRPTWEHGQVLAVLGGSGVVLVEGRWREAAAGAVYLNPPGRLHAYHCLPGGGWTVAWAIYRGDASPVRGEAPQLGEGDAVGFGDALRGLHREVLGAAQPAVLTAWAALVDVLARRLALAGEGQRLAAVWQAVAAEPARPWTLAQLARLAGVGPEQLRRRCQTDLGVSPLAQVAHLRLRQAALLLAGGRMSVAAVAAAVGYANPFAFSTAFRRVHGCPPSQWGRSAGRPR